MVQRNEAHVSTTARCVHSHPKGNTGTTTVSLLVRPGRRSTAGAAVTRPAGLALKNKTNQKEKVKAAGGLGKCPSPPK